MDTVTMALQALNSVQTFRELKPAHGLQASCKRAIPDLFGEPLHAGEPCVLVISTYGSGFLSDWAGQLSDHPAFIDAELFLQSDRFRLLERCDAILLCCADEAKLPTLIAYCHRRSPQAAVFVVADQLGPMQRANLIRAGADDVLNCAMDVREGAARIRGMCLRMKACRAAG